MIQEKKVWNTVKAVILNPQQRSPIISTRHPPPCWSNWIISPEIGVKMKNQSKPPLRLSWWNGQIKWKSEQKQNENRDVHIFEKVWTSQLQPFWATNMSKPLLHLCWCPNRRQKATSNRIPANSPRYHYSTLPAMAEPWRIPVSGAMVDIYRAYLVCWYVSTRFLPLP